MELRKDHGYSLWAHRVAVLFSGGGTAHSPMTLRRSAVAICSPARRLLWDETTHPIEPDGRGPELRASPSSRRRRTRRTSAMNDVTRILSAIEQGDPQAAEQLLPLVYDELRKLAARRLAQEKPGQTLQATALVHEAYLRLVGRGRGPALERPRPLLRRRGRGHAPHPRRAGPAQAGRQARRRRPPRGPRGRRRRLHLAGRRPPRPRRGPDPAGRRGPQAARLVKLRYFAGLSIEEAAEVVGISPATAYGTGPTPGPGSGPCWTAAVTAGGPEFFGHSVRTNPDPEFALTSRVVRPASDRSPCQPTCTRPESSSSTPSASCRRRSGRPTSPRPAAATPSCERQVEDLLQVHREAGSFLDRPAAAVGRWRP